jgi:predicted MPP superfamily phosphohydrolase
MFYLSNVLLAAVPLAVYAGWRIRSLMPSRPFKAAFTAAYLLVAAGYPLAETRFHDAEGGWAGAVVLFGNYALPLMLYVIMAAVLADIAVGVLLLTRLVSKEAIRSALVRRLRLSVMLILPALVVAYGVINHNVLRVKEHRIEVPRRSSSARELTVVFMADLHFRRLVPERLLDSLTAKVKALKPDVILVGGDILESGRRDGEAGRYERAFQRMSSKYGIFAVQGNHDRYGRAADGDFFARAGIRLLLDEVVVVDGAFVLAGRRDSWRSGRKSVDELLADAPKDLPVILLAHMPVELDQAERAGVDIQLSGHTHHGQLFPINWITSHEYELSWGYLKKGPTHVFVTSGVQLWGPPVRTVGASEILVIRVSFTGD